MNNRIHLMTGDKQIIIYPGLNGLQWIMGLAALLCLAVIALYCGIDAGMKDALRVWGKI